MPKLRNPNLTPDQRTSVASSLRQRLTDDELLVAGLVCDGLRVDEIAAAMGTSQAGVGRIAESIKGSVSFAVARAERHRGGA